MGLLLLIACVNIGNLSFVRLLARDREIAVRRAIGAGSTDVVRLFAIENALLGTLGGAAGCLTVVALLRIVRAAAPPRIPVRSAVNPQVHRRVSAFPTVAVRGEAGKQLVRRFEATPGVVAATPTLSEPFMGQSVYMMKLARVEQPATEREQNPFVPFEFVGQNYFRTFAIPILRGRGFTGSDTRGSERVVVVDETLANQLWPDQDPLGKRLANVTEIDTAFTVVGVASDTRFRELRNVGPVAYFVLEQVSPGWDGLLAVRTTRPLADMLPALRAASHDVNPALVLWDAKTMD